MKLIPGIFLALVIISLASFALMGIDKSRAVRKAWRIPERIFFSLAILGGSAGILAGMLVFRHKTRHWGFRAGIPLILLAQLILVALLLIGV